MAHVIDHADGHWFALVDHTGPTPHKAKLTPTSTQVNTTPPVFKIPATWAGLIQLLTTLPSATLSPAALEVAQVMAAARMGPWPAPTYQPPEGLTPYPWQVEAQARFPHTLDLMLGDDPGTGKTISTALAIAEAYAVGAVSGPTLVVAPAGVLTSWLDALATWTPHLDAVRYMGPKRHKLLEDWDAPGTTEGRPLVMVSSYETTARDVAKLVQVPWGVLVTDEHHLIKSPNTARSKAARKLAAVAEAYVALSGTPITHHPGDLWAPLYCLEPAAFPSRVRYRDRYLDTVPTDYGEGVAGFLPHRRGEFDLGLLGVQRRVAKADVLPWLPAKVYQVREVDMPKDWRRHYKAMEDELVAQLPDSDEPLNAFSVLAQLSFLQALAAGPCEVSVDTTINDDGEEVKHYHAHMKPGSWKVAELLDVLEERPTEQVVVFSPSRQLVELAGQALDEANIGHRYVVGGQSSGERDQALEDFQAGRARVILVVTAAGGVGITLTAASCAVFLSRPWSLVEALQAEDRVHRIGSEVHHHYIDIVDIVTTDTVDAAIRRRLVDKADQLGDVLRDPRVVRDVLGGKL